MQKPPLSSSPIKEIISFIFEFYQTPQTPTTPTPCKNLLKFLPQIFEIPKTLQQPPPDPPCKNLLQYSSRKRLSPPNYNFHRPPTKYENLLHFLLYKRDFLLPILISLDPPPTTTHSRKDLLQYSPYESNYLFQSVVLCVECDNRGLFSTNQPTLYTFLSFDNLDNHLICLLTPTTPSQ